MTQDAEFYFKRSAERYKAGDVGGGDADLDQAIALAADNLEYRWERGACRYQAKDYEPAVEDFSKITELSTDMNDLEDVYRMLAILHSALALTQEFFADLDWLVKHDAADDTVYFYHGQHQFESGHYQEALGDFNAALEQEPGMAEYLLQRSNVYAEFKRYEDAISDLTVALNIKNLYAPLSSVIYLKRATAFFKLGDQVKAYADYEESVRLVEGNRFASADEYFAAFSDS